MTISTNNSAALGAAKLIGRAPKSANLVSQSTTTMIIVSPREAGNPVIKFIVNSSQDPVNVKVDLLEPCLSIWSAGILSKPL